VTSPELNDPKTGGPANPRRFQFSLRWLLAVPVWLALFFASIAWWGFVGAIFFTFLFCLGYTLLVRPPANASCPFRRLYVLWLPGWIVFLFIIGTVCPWQVAGWLALLSFSFVLVASLVFLVMGLYLPSMHWFCAGLGLLTILLVGVPLGSGGREAARRSMCNGRLKQIGLALHNYHDRFGCFPPAYVADADGRPLYSWRVLILPYVEQKPLSDAWNFDEPWDSPNNLSVSQTPLDLFLCPSDEQSTAGPGSPMTSYLAIVGPETMWPGSEARAFGDVSDGTSNTLLVVEVHNSGVHWAEPRDLHVDQMAAVINPEAGQGISSAHEHGANVLFADGSVQFLSSETSTATLKALLTIAGGE